MRNAPVRQPRWGSLTEELKDKNGPVRRLLADAFPLLRGAQDDYRDTVGPCRLATGTANPGTIGTAFDVWVQLQATPRPQMSVACAGAALAGGDSPAVYEQLLSLLGSQERVGHQPAPGPWTGPSRGLDERDLLRLCWASACMVEVYRTGMICPGSPLAGSPLVSPDDLLALATDAAVDELSALVELARDRLIPQLHALSGEGPTWLNPTFAGSDQMNADGDVVTGHVLVELKTGLGRKTLTGRKASLDGPTLLQLLGYVLHDHDDSHGITALGLYQARYGHLAVWPLHRLLPELAGAPVDLPLLRRRWRSMLDTGQYP